MKKQRFTLRTQLWCTCTLTVILLCGGCHLSKAPESTAELEQKLSGIETVQLADLSKSEPVSIEEATNHLVNQISEPNSPPEELPLTLEEVRSAALENNLSLQVELVNPTRAQASLDAERAKFEAVFFGSTRYNRNEGLGTGVVTKSNSYDIGVSKPLPTGGSLTVGAPFSDSDSANAPGVSDARVSVTYFQSLLRGAGTSINRQSIQIAEISTHIVDAGTKLRAISLLSQADRAYWRVYTASKELEVRREQYKLAQGQLDNAEKMVAAGAAARNEIVRAEAGLSSRLEGLINAETNLRNRERDLRRIMNRPDLPLNSTTRILPQSHPAPQGLDLDERALVSYALENRMDMIQLEQYLKIDDLDIVAARNSLLPDLGLDTQFGARNRGDGWGDSYQRFGERRYQDLSVGLSATIPLGNQAAKAHLRRAKLTRIQSRNQRNELRQFIELEVQEAISDLDRNWRRILAAEQGVTAADRNYRVEQSQFQLGRRNSTDVLLATSSLGEAQLARIRAYADYEVAQIYLAQATGTLLGYGRIMIQPIQLSANAD